jgi:hypothetical protein
MWFEELTGFKEQSPDQVRELLSVEGDHIHSLVNGRSFRHGRLEIPSLQELRARLKIRIKPDLSGAKSSQYITRRGAHQMEWKTDA